MAKRDKKTPDQEKESITSGISKKFRQSPGLYIGSVVILVLVVVTFIGGDLLSGGGFGRGGGDLTFGYYDKSPISYVPGNMFSQYVERVSQFYRNQGIDPNDFRFGAQMWRQAYEAAIVHTAVLQVMNRSDYVIPKRVVDRNVAQLPQFQENGRFSSALYNQMSESSRSSLWRQTQDELIKIMFFSDLFGLLIPSSEADFIANMPVPSRNFDMVSFNVDNFPAEEYLSYARENSDLFNSIHMSRITVSNEREARQLHDQIKNGTNLFEDAARSHSQDSYADRGGDMGNRYFYELEREILNADDRKAVFALTKGALSDVINTFDGWTFFRIEEELVHADFEDETVMDRVRSYVRSFQRGRMEDWAIAQANEFITDANESGFATATRWRFMESQSFGPLPINYGGVDLFTSLESFSIPGFNQHELGSIASNENFWRIAFSAQLNTASEPLVQGNHVLVFYPTEQVEVLEDTINNIASMYTSYWLNNITEQSLQFYFLSQAKMEDNFWDVYFRIFN